jgi:capsular polysaccharide biosynthesis protein
MQPTGGTVALAMDEVTLIAEIAAREASPKLKIAGVTLGFGAAFAREQLDNTVHTRDELQLLSGAPVLGAIPRMDLAPIGANGHGRKGAPLHARLVDE